MTAERDPASAAPKQLVMPTGGKGDFRAIGGSNFDEFNQSLMNAAINSLWLFKDATSPDRDNAMITALQALRGIAPKDEVEGMLAAQMVAMHAASMECSRRAMISEQPAELAHGFRKAAASASRTFIELSTALDRRRGKGGQQKVTVEHVHVHAGGQAIVGAVTPNAAGGRGGSETRTAAEPHASPAALANDAPTGAGIPALRGEMPERNPVPIGRNEERSMQATRGQEHRAANRGRA